MSGFGMGAGEGPARFSRTQGRGGGQAGMSYPSPFFDIGQTYLPATVKQMFRWCRYYFLVNPLINAVVSKMSEYPVTDVLFDTEQMDLKDTWKKFLLEQLKYRSFQIEVGLDYYTYGNALVSIFYPFVKMLKCVSCKHEKTAADAEYRFMNFEFHWNCPKCGTNGPAKVRDHYIRAPRDIRLIRWNPEDIDIKYNEVTGDYEYYYAIPTQLRNDLIIGKKSVVETVPQMFVEALKQKKAVVFSKDNIFHFKRPTLAGKDRGWGTPMILPVLKDTFYLQILRKAQEAIALEHIVPLRIIFPQAGSATSDPYTSVNLSDWKEQISSEIRRWRSDNNYIPILPLPVGNQTIGGDGRAMLLSQEIRVWSEHIVAGMGVPTELIFGGISYSGSNVSLRMLENTFLGYLSDHLGMLRWVIQRTSAYLGWAPISVRYKPFKMADDLQRKAYLFQLNQANKLSDESLLADADFDSAKEDKIMEQEAVRRVDATRKKRILEADVEGEAQMASSKWQSKVQLKQMKDQMVLQNEQMKEQMATQAEMQRSGMQDQMDMQQGRELSPSSPAMTPSPRHPELLEPPKELQSPLSLRSVQKFSPGTTNEDIAGAQNVDVLYAARQIADRVVTLPEIERSPALAHLKNYNAELYDTVRGLMATGSQGPSAAAAGAARPLPEQRSPRRGPEAALI